MKFQSFFEKVAVRFRSDLLKRRNDVKTQEVRKVKSQTARLEQFESRELLTAQISSGVALVTSDADSSNYANIAGESPLADVVIPFNVPTCAEFVQKTATLSGAKSEFVPASIAATHTVTSFDDSETTEGTLPCWIKNSNAGDTIIFDKSFEGGTISLNGTQLEIFKDLSDNQV